MPITKDSLQSLRPADVCKALLAALDAADGRRRKRKRDQTPDSIGLSIKRELLEHAVRDDPSPEAFDEWLLNYPTTHADIGIVGSSFRHGESRFGRMAPGAFIGGF